LKERFVSDAIQRSLHKQVTVRFTEVPFADALATLAKEHGVSLWIDRMALANEGIQVEEEVTLHMTEVSLSSVLRLICEPLGVQLIVQDEVLVATSEQRARESLETRVYDVGPLLFRKNVDELTEAITSCIQPDSWDEVGGPGSVQAMNDPPAIVIRQDSTIHVEIGALLESLQRDVGAGAGKGGQPSPAGSEQTIREKLAESCDLNADNTALDRVLAEIASKHRIPLWIDHRRLQDEGIQVDHPVAIHLQGVRIESALNLLLNPLDLAWLIKDDVLKVTTRAKAAESLITRSYDIRDLARPFELTWPPRAASTGPASGGTFGAGGGMGMGGMGGGMFQVVEAPPRPLILRGGFGGVPGQLGMWDRNRLIIRDFDADDLIKVITSTIQSDSWDIVGGAGSVRQFRNTLVVRQTELAHTEIGGLLRTLRTVKRRNVDAPAREDSRDAMKRVVYDLSRFDYPPEDLARLIPDLVAPTTWQNAKQGGSAMLHVQPKSLVITQTKANHDEIVKLLYQVVLKFEE